MKSWSFGVDNDKLIELVLMGKKTATTSNYDENELPIIGEESIIHFDNEKEACVVKTIDYKIMKFKEMTEDLASLEGEGDLSLDYWRKVHFDFFKSYNPDFNDDTLVVFEEFKVVRNLVNERLELGREIANKNLNFFKEIKSIKEINAGFNNTLFNINDKYIIKACTNKELESTFKVEYNFYESNKNNKFIPKLYKYDDSKKDVKYIYEIIEKLEGNTLYYYWYKMNENEREETIKKLMLIVKEFHSNKKESYDWLNKIKNDILNKINECKTLFSKEDYNMIINSINKYDNYLIDNRFALIHNDLHFDNIIYNNGVLKIIDFNDSIYAPIDFEFRQLYMCQEKPWKWANIEMDPYQKPDAYKNIWIYIKKYYKELNDIKYLEQRMIIYRIWHDADLLKRYHSKELINGIIDNSRKL